MTLALLLVSTLAHADIAVPMDGFAVSQKNFKLGKLAPYPGDGQVVPYFGRSALRLGRGFAMARGVDFRDGTIDVDMAPDPEGQFLGVAFHVRSEDEYELFFFRPGATGTLEAVQYTPGFHGANVWQLMNGPGNVAAADLTPGKWMHVKIVVAGLTAKLFLGDGKEPVLTVNELRHGAVSGTLGFWAHSGGGGFANLRYSASAPVQATPTKAFLPGTLADWQLSEAFDGGDRDAQAYPDVKALHWEPATAENPGMVIINRYRTSPNISTPERADEIRGNAKGGGLVYARTTLRADKDEVRRLAIGYSDDIVVFLNGKPVFAGKNLFGFREPRHQGRIESDSETVFLPLRRGENELVFAVTEYFGGWGFAARLL